MSNPLLDTVWDIYLVVVPVVIVLIVVAHVLYPDD